MNSRDKILSAIVTSQPELTDLPAISFLEGEGENAYNTFISTLMGIGGKVFEVNDYEQIINEIKNNTTIDSRKITTIPELTAIAELAGGEPVNPHGLENIELSIIKAHFGVAENGAVWITEAITGQRVLPFICQHLAVVVNAKDVVSTMHNAYQRISDGQYGFGTFIAGPSKTADIEQSLVLGAHGPRTMTVFLLNQ
jgi:L-lactate dehydrogenase complex protein LldG